MPTQATGKRQHLPMRFRTSLGQDVLLFDTRIGSLAIGSAEELRGQWRPGKQLDVVVAVPAGSEAQKVIVAGFKMMTGMDVELLDGGVTAFTRKVIGVRFVRATRVQPTAEQLTLTSQANMAGLPVFYQALCRNESFP